MSRTVNLYDAKTNLSALVEEAAEGTEIVIAKNGVPKARLVPVAVRKRKRRRPSGMLKISFIADNFDAVDPHIVKLFEGE